MYLLLILVRPMGLEPIRSPTRPSNVRVCQFRHGRIWIFLQEGVLNSKSYYTYVHPPCQPVFQNNFEAYYKAFHIERLFPGKQKEASGNITL